MCKLTPEINKSITQTIDAVTVKALGLKHMSYIEDSVDIEQYMKNVGFSINMDGVRIFHSGDTKMDNLKGYMAKNGKWKDPVDVAFLYYDLLNDGKADLDYLRKTLNQKYIVVMHVPPSMYREWSEKVNQLKSFGSTILLFRNSLDTKVLVINQ